MKRILQWIENKADVIANECCERSSISNTFGAGALAIAASFVFPISPIIGLGIMGSTVMTYGLARVVGSVCRVFSPRPC
jgi:hypothetical protein